MNIFSIKNSLLFFSFIAFTICVQGSQSSSCAASQQTAYINTFGALANPYRLILQDESKSNDDRDKAIIELHAHALVFLKRFKMAGGTIEAFLALWQKNNKRHNDALKACSDLVKQIHEFGEDVPSITVTKNINILDFFDSLHAHEKFSNQSFEKMIQHFFDSVQVDGNSGAIATLAHDFSEIYTSNLAQDKLILPVFGSRAGQFSPAKIVQNLFDQPESRLGDSVLGLVGDDGSVEQAVPCAQDKTFQANINPCLQKITALLKRTPLNNREKDELFDNTVGCVRAYVDCGYDFERFQEDVYQSNRLQLRQKEYIQKHAPKSKEHVFVVSHIDTLNEAYKILYSQASIPFEQVMQEIFVALQAYRKDHEQGMGAVAKRINSIESEIAAKKAEIVSIKASLGGNKKLAKDRKKLVLFDQQERERLALEQAHKEAERLAKEARIQEQESRAKIKREAKELVQAEAAARKKERNRLQNEQSQIRAKRLAALEKLQRHGQGQNCKALAHSLNQWKAFVIDIKKDEEREQQKKRHALRASMFDVISLRSLLNGSGMPVHLVPTTYNKKLKKETKEQAMRAKVISNGIFACHAGVYPVSHGVDALDLSGLHKINVKEYMKIDPSYYKNRIENIDSRLWVQEHLRGQIESHTNMRAYVPEGLELRKGAERPLPFAPLCITCKKNGFIVVDGVAHYE